MKTYFQLRGEFDVANAGQIPVLLRTCKYRSVVVDCTYLTFIDAAGIGALLSMYKELRRQNRQLRLVNTSPCFSRILEILDLKFLTI